MSRLNNFSNTRGRHVRAGKKPGQPEAIRTSRAAVVQGLKDRGLTAIVGESAVRSLTLRAADLSPDQSKLLLDGVALGLRHLTDNRDRLADQQRDVHALERWLGDFTAEMSKMDEVVKVLSAYLHRMRNKDRASSKPSLH